MSPYQKHLYSYWDLLVAVMILVGIAFSYWIDPGSGSC
jgi:hypothetical protein